MVINIMLRIWVLEYLISKSQKIKSNEEWCVTQVCTVPIILNFFNVSDIKSIIKIIYLKLISYYYVVILDGEEFYDPQYNKVNYTGSQDPRFIKKRDLLRDFLKNKDKRHKRNVGKKLFSRKLGGTHNDHKNKKTKNVKSVNKKEKKVKSHKNKDSKVSL